MSSMALLRLRACRPLAHQPLARLSGLARGSRHDSGARLQVYRTKASGRYAHSLSRMSSTSATSAMPTPAGEPIPVMISGAGPAGLILALVLSMNNVRVRLLEREVTHRVGSKGGGMMPRTLEMYSALGVLDDLLESACPLPMMRQYKLPGGTEIEEEYPLIPSPPEPTPDRPFMCPHVTDQDHMESVFRDHLKRRFGVEVEMGMEVVGFEQDTDGVHVRVKNHTAGEEQSLHAQYLVGSDGGRSTVRKRLGLTFEGESLPDCMIYGDAIISGIDHKYCHLFGSAKDVMIALRAPNRVGSKRCPIMVAGKQLKNPERLYEDPKELEKFFVEFTGRTDIKFEKWEYLAGYRPNVRMVDTFGKGRVFVAGDAAHTHTSAGGQGLNSSVRDSYNLGWKLALVLRGLSKPTLLDTYTEERLPVIKEMLEMTTALMKTMAKGGKRVARSPAFFQLGMHSQWSSIVYDERREGGRLAKPESTYEGGEYGELWAGDRAPDAPGLRVLEGREGTTTLFNLLHVDKHTVLVFVGKDTTVDEARALLDIARNQPSGCCSTVLILEQEQEHAVVQALAGAADVTVVDTEGYVSKFYNVQDGLRAAVVRPDGVVGAMVNTAAGLEHSFGLVFTAGQ